MGFVCELCHWETLTNPRLRVDFGRFCEAKKLHWRVDWSCTSQVFSHTSLYTIRTSMLRNWWTVWYCSSEDKMIITPFAATYVRKSWKKLQRLCQENCFKYSQASGRFPCSKWLELEAVAIAGTQRYQMVRSRHRMGSEQFLSKTRLDKKLLPSRYLSPLVECLHQLYLQMNDENKNLPESCESCKTST